MPKTKTHADPIEDSAGSPQDEAQQSRHDHVPDQYVITKVFTVCLGSCVESVGERKLAREGDGGDAVICRSDEVGVVPDCGERKAATFVVLKIWIWSEHDAAVVSATCRKKKPTVKRPRCTAAEQMKESARYVPRSSPPPTTRGW